MNKKTLFFFSLLFLLVPLLVFPLTLVRVGYMDLNKVIDEYSLKYLDTEITIREKYVDQLYQKYNEQYFQMEQNERMEIQDQIMMHNNILNMLRYNQMVYENSGEIKNDTLYQIIQRDIMQAIKKTSEVEGYHLILNNTGNFIYGSQDINLTGKVLFRLDERLMELQQRKPAVPIAQELKSKPGTLTTETTDSGIEETENEEETKQNQDNQE